jgi:hypothetical protein
LLNINNYILQYKSLLIKIVLTDLKINESIKIIFFLTNLNSTYQQLLNRVSRLEYSETDDDLVSYWIEDSLDCVYTI